MNAEYVDPGKFKNAYWTCLIFAAVLFLFAFFVLVLVVTTPHARPERTAYAIVMAAAGGTHLFLFWMLHQARKPSNGARLTPRR